MAYDGRYGKVAKAVKKKRAHNRFNTPDTAKNKNGGVPRYKHKDSTTGAPQDGRKKHPNSMKGVTPSASHFNHSVRQGGSSYGGKSPKLPTQNSSHPVKRGKRRSAKGFRSFKSIIKGNVMGTRPPKKLAPQSRG